MATKTQTSVLSEFIDAITEASACASQLVHIQQDPRWIPIRDTLLQVRSVGLRIVVKGIIQ